MFTLMATNLGGLKIGVANANAADLTFGPSGETVGSWLQPNDVIGTFNVSENYTTPLTVTMFFPAGTVIDPGITASDLIISQMPTVEREDSPNSIQITGTSIIMDSFYTLYSGGTISVKLSGTASGDEIRLSTTTTTEGTFSVSFADVSLSISTVTLVPDVATQVRVEDGTEIDVWEQTIYIGDTLTAYAITRDQYGNFIENVAATAWSLEGETGGVVDGDLSPALDMKSAIFTGGATGTATIHATLEGLTPGDSGTITVEDFVPPPDDCPPDCGGDPTTYTLTYTAGEGGYIDGVSPQIVYELGSGATVTAVPNAGYHFISWSDDELLPAERTDADIINDITVTANFAVDTLFASGSGTSEDPYRIETCAQLQNMRTDLDADYVLTSDIDCAESEDWNESALVTGISLTLVSGTTYSTGYTNLTGGEIYVGGEVAIEDSYTVDPANGTITFDVEPAGAVTADLTYLMGFNPIGNPNDTPATYFSGTFDGYGYVISNLYINQPVSTPVTGGGGTGFFGETDGATIQNVGLEDVYIIGVDWAVGALIGYSHGDTSVLNTYATGSVTGANRLGGLVGANQGGAFLRNSYSVVDVNVREGGGQGVGGIVGYLDTGAGSNSLFWNNEIFLLGENGIGTGKTTLEMGDRDTFADWDFDSIWLDPEGVGYPTLRKTHEISTCQELQDIAVTYSNDTASEDVYKLVDDIDCATVIDGEANEGYFDPIGTFSDESDTGVFVGVLDGNNKTISNLNIDIDAANVGLFGFVSSAIFKDLTFSSSTVNSTQSGSSAGLLAGSASGITIDNVVSSVDITSVGTAGGFVGYLEDFGPSTITSSSVSSDITGGADGVGGFVGNISLGNACVSEEFELDISTSYFSGNVLSGVNSVGGMLGSVGFDDDDCDIQISQSYTSGSVAGGGEKVGGVIGSIYNDSYDGTGVVVVDSYSVSDVSGLVGVGGMVGYNGYSTSIIENSYFGGTVAGTDSDSSEAIGGFVGGSESGSDLVLNSFMAGIITSERIYDIGFFIGYTDGLNVGAGIDSSYYYNDGSIWQAVGNDEEIVVPYVDNLSYFKAASYPEPTPPISSWDFVGGTLEQPDPVWVATEGFFPTLYAIAADDPLTISFETPPTPVDSSIINGTSAEISVATNSSNQHYIVNNFDDSLVGWWRGEDNATDESGTGNNGSFDIDGSGYTIVDTTSATASASNTYLVDPENPVDFYLPGKAFDGDPDTKWFCDGNTGGYNGTTQWLEIDLGVGNEATVTKTRLLYNEPTEAMTGRIQGSNDDSAWTDLKSFSHGVNNTWYNDYISNSTSYRYYRLFIDTGTPSANWPEIYEWELYTGEGVGSYSAGKFGQAFDFDGTNYVTVASDESLQTSDNFTVSAWVKPVNQGVGWKTIIGNQWHFPLSGYLVSMDGETGQIHVAVGGGGSFDNVDGVTNIADGSGHLVTVAFSAGNIKIYVDGELDKNYDTVGISSIAYATNNFTIGRNSDGDFEYWTGLIDDISIFNRVLSLGEIASLYDASANQYSNTFTDLAGGEHTDTAYAVDLDGNKVSTSERTFSVEEEPSFAGGDGSPEDVGDGPWQIANCQQLQAINSDVDYLDDYYILVPEGETDTIDCSATSGWNDGAGFEPIGTLESPFTGHFDGDSKTIDGLNIDRSETDYVGLFGVVQIREEDEESGRILNVSLTDVYVNGHDRVGGLVGKMFNHVEVGNSNVEGNISGNDYVGGLAGGSLGSITTSETNITVDGRNYVGGMVGALSGTEGDYNQGYILGSYSSGQVQGSEQETGGLVGVMTEYGYVSHSSADVRVAGYWNVGGLIGAAQGYVENSFATGEITADEYGAGGLIGYLDGGEVYASFATGSVTAHEDGYELDAPSSYAGGLVGMANNGDIYESYATGDVLGISLRVGGLVGGTNALVQDCYATGNVTAGDGGNWYIGGERAGGLVGGLSGEVVNSYATGTVQGNKYVGGLVGIDLSGEISYSFSTGTVTGEGIDPTYIGDFIGQGGDVDYGALYDYYVGEGTPVGDGRESGDPILGESIAYFQGLDVASQSPFSNNWIFSGGDQAWGAFEGLYPTLEAIEADDPFTIQFVTPPTPADEETLASNTAEVKIETTGDGPQSYVINNLDNSLIGWWRGEENANDDSVHDASGDASDGVSYIEGKFGQAFDFSQGYVDLQTESFPVGTDPVTISLWFKTDSCDSTYLFVYGAETEYSQRALICEDSSTLMFSGFGSDILNSGLSTTDGEWHQIAGVYDGQYASLYYDGSLLTQAGAQDWDTEMDGGARIGASLSVEGQLDGSVDDVLVFDRVLSAGEIKALYDASSFPYDVTFDDLSAEEHTIEAYVVNTDGDLLVTDSRTFTASESAIQNPVETILDENQFHDSGEAQGWNDDDNVWTYELPFDFTFYGVTYSAGDYVYVSSNGYIAFEDPDNEYDFGVADGIGVPIIVAMSGDLDTDSECGGDGSDIYITDNEDGQVIFRWQGAEHSNCETLLNFEIVLRDDNTFDLNYGEMIGDLSENSSVGVNNGNDMYVLSEYSDLVNYDMLDTSAWDWPAGGVDDVYVDFNYDVDGDDCGEYTCGENAFDNMEDAIDAVAEGGTIHARNNWWGDATGPSIVTNPSGQGTQIVLSDSYSVLYRPFCTNESCSAEDLSEYEVEIDDDPDTNDLEILFDDGGTMSVPGVDNGDYSEITQIDVEEDTVITIPVTESSNTIITLPAGTAITRHVGEGEDDTFNAALLNAVDTATELLSNFGAGTLVGAFEWGIPDLGLQFSEPITVDMYVGADLSGDTLTVQRSISLDGGWTQDGLLWIDADDERNGTCIVSSEGICSFRTTLASYYIAGVPASSGGGGGSSLLMKKIAKVSEVTTFSFKDVARETGKNAKAIYDLYQRGVVKGYEDGNFKPEIPVNRAQILKMLVAWKVNAPDPYKYKNCFPDVKTQWYAPYVCYAKEQGWVEGYLVGEYKGLFKPELTASKAQTMKMLLNVLGVEISKVVSEKPFDDVALDAWYAGFIAKAKELGILEETGKLFTPGTQITRGGFAENLSRLLTKLGK